MVLFNKRLNSMVAAEVKPLINIRNGRISAESVKKVNEITTRLGNDVIKKD
jgi:hypothetical protein